MPDQKTCLLNCLLQIITPTWLQFESFKKSSSRDLKVRCLPGKTVTQRVKKFQSFSNTGKKLLLVKPRKVRTLKKIEKVWSFCEKKLCFSTRSVSNFNSVVHWKRTNNSSYSLYGNHIFRHNWTSLSWRKCANQQYQQKMIRWYDRKFCNSRIEREKEVH